MLDLSTKQCPADWRLRMQNATSQLDIDPISMNGLNSMLELCDGGNLTFALLECNTDGNYNLTKNRPCIVNRCDKKNSCAN